MNLRKAVVGIIIFSILVFVPIWAFAAGLVPCGGPGESACSLCHLFELAQKITDFLTFTIAPILAVLAVAWGGFNIFIAGADPGKVKVGREAITRAAIGLLIVFGAWVAINEVLIFFSQQTATGTANIFNKPWTDITCSTKIVPTVTAPPPSATAEPATFNINSPWPDDGDVRAALMKNSFAINVNIANCATVGQGVVAPKGIGGNSCTSVYNLGSKAISGLRNLHTRCQQAETTWRNFYQGCGITVTGGTEYWLHGGQQADINQNPTFHKPEEFIKDKVPYIAVDIRSNETLSYITDLIKTGTSLGIPSTCSSLGQGWRLDGNIYVLENIGVTEHWHICYY